MRDRRLRVAVLALVLAGTVWSSAALSGCAAGADDQPGTAEETAHSMAGRGVDGAVADMGIGGPHASVSPEIPADTALYTGRYLRSKNGGHIVDLDGQGAVSVDIVGDERMFYSLGNGDRIQVRLGMIQETYPGGARAYEVKRLEKGDIGDVNADTLISLTELGWLEPAQETDRMFCMDGVLLRSTGREVSPECGTPDGRIISTVAFCDIPTEDGQANFSSVDADYICLDERAAAVRLEGRYVLFLAEGTVEYEGRFFQAEQLSPETLEWLDFYNSLPPEERLKISMVPHDLVGQGDEPRPVACETAVGETNGEETVPEITATKETFSGETKQ